MKIFEVLDKPYSHNIDNIKYAQGVRSNATITANFDSEHSKFEYVMMISDVKIPGDIAIVGTITFQDAVDETIRLTGKGEAFRVLATVHEITKHIVNDPLILKDYVSKIYSNAPQEAKDKTRFVEVLTFSASRDEPSRVKLYERLAKRIRGFSIARQSQTEHILISDKTDLERKSEILDKLHI